MLFTLKFKIMKKFKKRRSRKTRNKRRKGFKPRRGKVFTNARGGIRI